MKSDIDTRLVDFEGRVDANGLADLGIMPLGSDQKPASQNLEQQNKLKLNAGCLIWLEIWYQVSHWAPEILISSYGDCPMLVKFVYGNGNLYTHCNLLEVAESTNPLAAPKICFLESSDGPSGALALQWSRGYGRRMTKFYFAFRDEEAAMPKSQLRA